MELTGRQASNILLRPALRIVMEHYFFVGLSLLFCISQSALAVDPHEGYSREQLQPLTKFRQQHQRTIDGRLCAAAFVQNRKAYTGCTDAPNPSGVSGRPWCYVEPQVGAASSYFANEHHGRLYPRVSCLVMRRLGIIVVISCLFVLMYASFGN